MSATDVTLLMLLTSSAIAVSAAAAVFIPKTLKSKKKTNNSTGGSSVNSSTQNGPEGEANLTFYDDAKGGTGIKFDAYPIKWNSKANVYPIAVHQSHFQKYAYKVLEVKANGKTFYGHVADMCDKDDASCKNAFKNGKSFLIDLHKSGWSAAGANDGILPAKFKVVGTILPKDLPASSLDGYVFCECKDATCDLEDAVWKPKGNC